MQGLKLSKTKLLASSINYAPIVNWTILYYSFWSHVYMACHGRGVRHWLESRSRCWDSRIWNLCLVWETLYNFRYFRILYLIFQLPWNLFWNPKLSGISNKDFKDSESVTLFYFVMDSSVMLQTPLPCRNWYIPNRRVSNEARISYTMWLNLAESSAPNLLNLYWNISVLFILVTLWKKIRKSQEILGNQDSANPEFWVNP